MKNLRNIGLSGRANQVKWLEWLLVLMRGAFLRQIQYSIQGSIHVSRPDDATKADNTKQVLNAFNENTNIMSLGFSWMEPNLQSSLIKAALSGRRARLSAERLTSKLTDPSTQDPASMFGRIISPHMHSFDSNAWLEILLRHNGMVRTCWDAGRQERIMKSEDAIRSATAQYFKAVGNAYSWRAGTNQEECVVASPAFQECREDIRAFRTVTSSKENVHTSKYNDKWELERNGNSGGGGGGD